MIQRILPLAARPISRPGKLGWRSLGWGLVLSLIIFGTHAATTSLPDATEKEKIFGKIDDIGADRAGGVVVVHPDVYSIRDFCDGKCETPSQQTIAFHRVEAKINAAKGGVLLVPAGHWVFDSRASGPIVFSTYAASIRGEGVGTTTITVYGGSFVSWTAVAGFPNGGRGQLSDLRIYENDNPSSGAQVLLDRSSVEISNVALGGGYVSLDLSSAVGVTAENLTLVGDNSNIGSVLLRVRRRSMSDVHSSENFFTNANIRGASGHTVTHAILIEDSDGFWLSNAHVGFASEEALLIRPEHTTDALDNIHSDGVDYDGGSYGVRFAPLEGWGGVSGNNVFANGTFENIDLAGLRVDDPRTQNLVLSGMSVVNSGSEAIDLEAGENIAITGGSISDTNLKHHNNADIKISGKTISVVMSGVAFGRSLKSRIENAIEISGDADFINIGSNNYRGDVSEDISVHSSGTHIGISPGVSDRTPVRSTMYPETPETYLERSRNPTAADIRPGTCRPWRNTANGSLRYYCNQDGTLKSATLN